MNAELAISIFVFAMLVGMLAFAMSLNVRVGEREKHLDNLNKIVDTMEAKKKKQFLILVSGWGRKSFLNFVP